MSERRNQTKTSLVAFQQTHRLKADALYGPDISAVLAANHVISNSEFGRLMAIRGWSATRHPPDVRGEISWI